MRKAEELMNLAELNNPAIRLVSKSTVAFVKGIEGGHRRNEEERRDKRTEAYFKCGKPKKATTSKTVPVTLKFKLR